MILNTPDFEKSASLVPDDATDLGIETVGDIVRDPPAACLGRDHNMGHELGVGSGHVESSGCLFRQEYIRTRDVSG